MYADTLRINGFKAFALIIFVCITICLVTNCEEEKAHARSYPQIKTDPVTNITGNGVTLNGNIYTLGSEPITDHGFVWSDWESPDLSDDKISLGPSSSTGAFSADVGRALAIDVEYTVKAFVKTAEHIVYGTPVTFVSMGSGAPVVTGFEPDSAAWLDTIRISGQNFSIRLSQNKVRLNQIECKLVSSTDTTIFFALSENVTQLKNGVSVEVAGANTTFTVDSLKLLAPRFRDFGPVSAFWGDTLTIRGTHLRSYNLKSDNYIRLGGVNSYSIGRSTDTTIRVLVPNSLSELTNSLTMRINGFVFQANEPLELEEPNFSFVPSEGTWGDVVTITGRLNSLSSMNRFAFISSGVESEVLQQYFLNTSRNKITFKVPDYLSFPESSIIYKSGPFTITSADTFRLYPPEIRSFSPLSGPSGTNLTIKGKYFSSAGSVVYLGDTPAQIKSLNDTLMVALVPLMSSGNYNVRVVSKSQSAIAGGSFSVENPLITRVSPLTATYNDLVTIEGQNLFNPSFSTTAYFNFVPIEIVTASIDRVVVKVPADIDNHPRYISVTVGLGSSYFEEPFYLERPQIVSVSPSAFPLGATITISGSGFNPLASANKVTWNSYSLPVISATTSSLVVNVPSSLPSGTGPLLLLSGGYSEYSTSVYEIASPWEEIPISQVDWNSSAGVFSKGIAFSLNGIGYLMSNRVPKMFSFDPGSNTFTYLNYFNEFYDVEGLVSVVNRDTAYIISGIKGLFRFDRPASSWIRIDDAPGTGISGTAFSLNGRIYYLLPDNEGRNKLWEYHHEYLQPWALKNPFPNYNGMNPISFTINNFGYVLFADRNMYRYDPVNDTWTKVSSYPGLGNDVTGRIVFSTSSLGYAGGGRDLYSGISYSDFWSYNPLTDTWKEEVAFPGESRFNSISFSIDNKGYIGFGWSQAQLGPQTQLFNILRYDPDKISK